MYLIVRLEQQQDHMRDVIASTRNFGNRQSLKLIIKIKDALSKLYGTMLSIRDDDEAVYNQIGTSINDLDEFFNMVENVCSAVEDIPVERKCCFEEQSTYFHGRIQKGGGGQGVRTPPPEKLQKYRVS